MNPAWRTRYDLAVEAARRAGDLARNYYESTFEVEKKADNTPVTLADREGEALIRGDGRGRRSRTMASSARNSATSRGRAASAGSSTRSTARSRSSGTSRSGPLSSVWSIAGEQIAGVAYIPVFGMTYRALRGDGAFVNERRIRVSDVSSLADSMICYSSINWFTRAGREKTFIELANRTARQRGYGDFYGFVLVAEGAAELMVEHGVNPWDVAATKAIIEEAGGTFTDWDGSRRSNDRTCSPATARSTPKRSISCGNV